LVLSDIPGDDMAQVASGPTLPDHRGAAEALAAIDNYRLDLPKRMRDTIATVQAPLLNDPVFKGHRARLIGSARFSLEAAAQRARALGIPAMILSDAIEGEAADIARMHAAIAREIALRDRPFRKPVLLLSGGETTVTLKGNGRGGRTVCGGGGCCGCQICAERSFAKPAERPDGCGGGWKRRCAIGRCL
jgi:hydroxypyruvate reductase